MLNVHPSLLPRWRGAAPIERAIEAGDEETGVTIMRPTAELDAGPICLQRAEAIAPDDDYGSLAPRLAALGGELLVEALDTEPAFREQPDQGVTYAEKIEPGDRRLDPARPADELERRVRALTPHIGAYVELDDGERLGVRRAALAPASTTSSRARSSVRDSRLALRRRPGRARAARGAAGRQAADGRGGLAARHARAEPRPASGYGRCLHAAERREDQLGPDCPSCGEPWLRGTNLAGPLPLRLLPAPLRAALGVPQLRRALDDRPHVGHRERHLPQLRRHRMLPPI